MAEIIQTDPNTESDDRPKEIWTPENFEQEPQGKMEQVKSQAKQAAKGAKEGLSEKANQVKEKAEHVYKEAADTVSHVRDKSADALSHVRDQAEQAGRKIRDYIQEKDLSDMAEEVSGVIRRYPLPAVLIGVGVGFLLARTATRSHR